VEQSSQLSACSSMRYSLLGWLAAALFVGLAGGLGIRSRMGPGRRWSAILAGGLLVLAGFVSVALDLRETPLPLLGVLAVLAGTAVVVAFAGNGHAES
jgi:hypothetical protein